MLVGDPEGDDFDDVLAEHLTHEVVREGSLAFCQFALNHCGQGRSVSRDVERADVGVVPAIGKSRRRKKTSR